MMGGRKKEEKDRLYKSEKIEAGNKEEVNTIGERTGGTKIRNPRKCGNCGQLGHSVTGCNWPPLQAVCVEPAEHWTGSQYVLY